MHVRSFALVAFAALLFIPAVGNCQEPATIAAGNYRLDFTIMGQTMGEDVVVEYQHKKIIIRKPMQTIEYAIQGQIEASRLTAESHDKNIGTKIKLTGKISAKDAAEGDVEIEARGMKIAGTFKLKKR
jgi:hypothetical protein